MIRRRPSRIARLALSLSTLVLPTLALAQSPAPFSQTPADANYLVRLDFDALAASTAWRSVHEKLVAVDPNYAQAILRGMAEDTPAVGAMVEGLAGRLSAYEIGARFETANMDELADAATSSVSMVARGKYDKAALDSHLAGQGWAVSPESGGALAASDQSLFVATPDEATLVLSPSADRLAPAAGASAASGPLAAVIDPLRTAPAMMAFKLSPAQSEQLAAISQTPPAESYAIAGLPDLIKEAASLSYGAVAAGDGDTASVRLMLGFADDASAARATKAVNQVFPALAALGRSQAAGDAAALAQFDAFAAVKASATGPTVGLEFPLPEEIVAMIGDGLADALPAAMAEAAPLDADAVEMADAGASDPSKPLKIELMDEPAGGMNEAPRRADTEGGDVDAGADATAAKTRKPAVKIARGNYEATASPATVAGFIAADQREAFPLASVPAIDGGRVSFDRFRDKVVIVDFWATWCPPCRESTPTVVKVYNSFERSELAVVGISLDNDLDKMKAYAADHGMGWPMSCDLKVWEAAPVKFLDNTSFPVSGVPRFYVLDQKGRIAYYAHDWEPLGNVVQTLLAEAK